MRLINNILLIIIIIKRSLIFLAHINAIKLKIINNKF